MNGHPPEDLGALAALPPDDPRRVAFEADPIAAARLAAYEEFMTPGPLPPGADLAAAEARLLAAIDVATASQAPAGRRPSSFRLAPALAVAAALVVAVGLWTQVARRERAAPILRGPSAPEPTGGWAAHLVVTTPGPGSTNLSWAPAPGATHYEVVFLASDLSEVARVKGLAAPAFVLERASLPAGLTSGTTVLWRVGAYAGGDEVARSGTAPLKVP